MKKNELKVVYMGTPSISAKVLEDMINDGYNIVGVVAQPDKPVGRKGILEKVPTKVVAEKYNIPVFQPIKIRNDYEFLEEINPDIIITLAYGQIVPQGLLDIPKYGCLNLHGSLLPKYRGASPIQTAIINGDKLTGVTMMEMIDKMDAGRMYAKEEVAISDDDNTTTLFDKISIAASRLLLRELPKYINGELVGENQDESKVSVCHMIKSEQEKLNFDDSSEQIINYIRALADEPGGYFLLNDEKFKVYKAKKVNDKVSGTIGEIIEANKQGLILQCKDGQINLLEVQKAGKKRMDYKSFINGNQNIKGTILN